MKNRQLFKVLVWMILLNLVLFAASPTLAAGEPGKPVLRGPANNIILRDTTPTFRWTNKGALADVFRLMIATDREGSNIIRQYDQPISNTFTLPDVDALDTNATYFWRVQTQNANGPSPLSAVFKFHIAPGQVTTLLAPEDNAMEVKPILLDWENVANDFKGYEVQIGKRKAGNNVTGIVKFTRTAAGVSEYTWLNPGVGTYYWRVRAIGHVRGSRGLWSPIRKLRVAQPFNIAILGPFTGGVESLGLSMTEAVNLAAAEWNANKGILGKKVVPVFYDTQCSADQADDAALAALAAGNHYVVGDVCSGASRAVAEVANANQMVQISPTSTHPYVTVDDTDTTRPFTFRACFIDPYQGKAGAHLAFDAAPGGLGAAKAFILRNTDDGYSTGLVDAFKAEFETLGGTTTLGDYDNSTADFSALMDQIAADAPDVVYLPEAREKTNTIAQAAHDKGLTVPFIGPDAWEDPALDMVNTEGWYFTTQFNPGDADPAVQAFVTHYQAQYASKTPDAIAALSYDAMNVMLNSIKNAKKNKPLVVRNKMEAIQYDGVTGTIMFDAQHNPQKAAVIMQISGGAFVFWGRVTP